MRPTQFLSGLSAPFIIAVGMANITPGFAQTQTITNTGFCNIIIQGNNNTGTYINFCRGKSASNDTPFDPPTLWLGMDLATVKSLLGARSPYATTEKGLT